MADRSRRSFSLINQGLFSRLNSPTLHASLTVCFLLLVCGCRPAVPPSFSAGPEVKELTADIEDKDELALYKDLQSQIAQTLKKLCGTPEKIILLGAEESTDQLKQGYRVYSNYCTQCHGVNGDGLGPVAQHLEPKPRNYTRGIFKFTSTPYGSKPRRSDLMLTIRRGVTGTSMPSFDRLSEEDVAAVTEYVLALTYRGQMEQILAGIAYDEEELPDEESMADVVDEVLEPWQVAAEQLVMPVSVMPPMNEESIRTGHEIFLNKACNKCHGKFGRGGSMGNIEVGTDAWGNKAAAADLTSGMFRGGDRPIDIYRRIYSGINGTPMPAFNETFQEDPDAIWHLVHFIKDTGERRRRGLPPMDESDLPPAPTAEESVAEEPAEEEPAEETPPAEVDEAEETEAEENEAEPVAEAA